MITPFGSAGSFQIKVILGPCEFLGGTLTEDKDIGALGAGRVKIIKIMWLLKKES